MTGSLCFVGVAMRGKVARCAAGVSEVIQEGSGRLVQHSVHCHAVKLAHGKTGLGWWAGAEVREGLPSWHTFLGQHLRMPLPGWRH
jgi:hypothetical protein